METKQVCFISYVILFALHKFLSVYCHTDMRFQTLEEQNQRPQYNVKSTLTDQKLQYSYYLLQRRLSSRLTQVYIPLQNRKKSKQISPFFELSFRHFYHLPSPICVKKVKNIQAILSNLISYKKKFNSKIILRKEKNTDSCIAVRKREHSF